MLKNIALAGIFAVVSVVSLNPLAVRVARSNPAQSLTTPVTSPVMKGFGPCGAMACH
jgi:hypothetical protein